MYVCSLMNVFTGFYYCRPQLLLQIKNYYQFKIKHKNVYEGLVPSREKNIFDHDILTVLLSRDQNGRRVLILQLGSEYCYLI